LGCAVAKNGRGGVKFLGRKKKNRFVTSPGETKSLRRNRHFEGGKKRLASVDSTSGNLMGKRIAGETLQSPPSTHPKERGRRKRGKGRVSHCRRV